MVPICSTGTGLTREQGRSSHCYIVWKCILAFIREQLSSYPVLRIHMFEQIAFIAEACMTNEDGKNGYCKDSCRREIIHLSDLQYHTNMTVCVSLPWTWYVHIYHMHAAYSL